MSTAAQLVDALTSSLAAVFPTRVAELSNRTGAMTAVVALDRIDYDTSAMCDPVPATFTASVTLIAATTGQQGVRDLLVRADQASGLIRDAGWSCESCTAADADDAPALVFTATAQGEG